MEVAVRVVTNLLAGELPHKLTPPEIGASLDDAEGSSVTTDASDLYKFGYDDTVVVTVFTLLLLAARHLASRFILIPCAKSVGIHKQMKLQKFAEAGWFFVYYLPIFCWGLSAVLRYELSFPMEQIFANYPQETMSFEVKVYILVQYSFYFHALFVVGVLETRRKDYVEMCVHHVATIALMSMARATLWLNIAVTILVLHDFSDIFLYLAKVLNYCQFDNVTTLAFAIFAVSFAVARLFYFPCVIYAFITMSRVAAPEFSPTVYYSAIVAFCTLLCLHIFWFRSVVRMIGEALGQGKLEKDIRSDDDK